MIMDLQGIAELVGKEPTILRVQSGDIVVIESDQHLSCEQSEAIRDALTARLPKGVAGMLLFGGMTLAGVIRPS